MLKNESRTVAGMPVDVVQHPARRGLKLAGRLGRVIAPALSKAKGLSMDSDIASLAPALSALLGDLSDKDYDELLVEILCGTTVTSDGRRLTLDRLDRIDLVFGGDISALVQVCAFAVEVNFKDFIDAALRAGARGEAQRKATAEVSGTSS